MTFDKKLELAQQLSREYGMEGRKNLEESHYDRSTGTLFIGSRVYHKEDMERARVLMHEASERMRDRQDASCSSYEIAELAITKLMDESLAMGGRVVVKES